MGKIVSVYVNDSEVEMLETLKGVLGIPEESRVFKKALHHLGNEHMHGEPAPGRVEEGLRVEVPAMVQLRAMVKEVEREVKAERMAEENKPFGKKYQREIDKVFSGGSS